MSTAQANLTEEGTLPLSSLVESKTNPRKTFDGLAELADSIRQHGVIEPIVVRPAEDRYEIVCGARRYRAAKLAGLKEVPVRVRDFSDKDVLTIQLVENLQRADLHPLEEGEGYKELAKLGLSVKEISERVSKGGRDGFSISYVYQQMKLAELCDEAKKAFRDKIIDTGHAILIARLQPEQQKFTLLKLVADAVKRRQEVPSVKEMGRWIQENVHLDLGHVAWDVKDPNLVPKAGSCVACPKRMGNMPGTLKSDANVCTDPVCFKSKLEAWTKLRGQKDKKVPAALLISTDYTQRGKARTDGVLSEGRYALVRTKSDGCKTTVKAVVVETRNREDYGQVLTVCADPKCKKHLGWSSGIRDPKAQKREAARRKAAAAKQRRTLESRKRILRTILSKVKAPLSRADLEFVAVRLFERLWNDARRQLFSTNGWEPVTHRRYGFKTPDWEASIAGRVRVMTDTRLAAFFLEMALMPQLSGRSYGDKRDYILEQARARKVDVKAIERDVAKEAPRVGQKRESLSELAAKVREEMAHHAKMLKDGCQDPGYCDGTNLNLVRNHIIYGIDRINEAIKRDPLDPLSEVSLDALIVPDAVPEAYMAKWRRTYSDDHLKGLYPVALCAGCGRTNFNVAQWKQRPKPTRRRWRGGICAACNKKAEAARKKAVKGASAKPAVKRG